MTKFLKPIFIALSVAVFSTGSAVAEDVKKIATVDMKKLFDEYHLTKGAQEKVKANQAVIQKENNEKLEAIRAIAEELKTISSQISYFVIAS